MRAARTRDWTTRAPGAYVGIPRRTEPYDEMRRRETAEIRKRRGGPRLALRSPLRGSLQAGRAEVRLRACVIDKKHDRGKKFSTPSHNLIPTKTGSTIGVHLRQQNIPCEGVLPPANSLAEKLLG